MDRMICAYLAIDRPAIERAAYERGAREFAAWYSAGRPETVNARSMIYLVERFLKEEKP